MPDFKTIASMDIKSVLSEPHVDPTTGLSCHEATARQKQYGPNDVKRHTVTAWQILLRQFASPFFYLLVGAALLSFFLGQFVDAALIMIFIGINTGLGFYQEYRSEKSLALLTKYLVSRSRVRRDGKEELIDSHELVPGDIVILEPGDILHADVRFIEAVSAVVDESALTGESAPVNKAVDAVKGTVNNLFTAQNIGFSGTTMMGGKAIGAVFATGSDTTMGKVAKLTADTKRVSAFEKRIIGLSRFILYLISFTLLFVVIINLSMKKGEVSIIEFIIFSVALAVSVVPEALPVVTTFSLSRGALRLAKRKVVVKRLSAVEELGSMDVLCTDKTGTLTENILTIGNIWVGEHGQTADQVVVAASLASPFLADKKKEPNNSFDLALWNHLPEAERTRVLAHERVAEIPFDPARRRNVVLTRGRDGSRVIVRGAEEQVLPLCAHVPPAQKRQILEWVRAEGAGGRRVIAVAGKSALPSDTDLLKAEHDLALYGLISFVDPLKASAKDAIVKAKRLGVDVKILTGDGPEVASAVGKQVGLLTADEQAVTGAELMAKSPDDQRRTVETCHVFARVTPEQKYRIIELLRERHDVGFLGEGINDAPALKMADVGLVVHDASDIAREAADVVLLKKSLSVIIDGVQEGRAIFANITKYIRATIASNLGNFYAVTLSLFLIDYLPMLPIQLLLLNLLTDFPMIAVATDQVDADELRKPKSYDIKDIALFALVLGLVSSLFDFIFFFFFYRASPATLHTTWFIGSVLTELLFMFVVRSKGFFLRARRPSGIMIALTVLVAAVTIALPFSPWGARPFQFTRPDSGELGMVFLIVIAFVAVSEVVKLMYYHFFNQAEHRETHSHGS